MPYLQATIKEGLRIWPPAVGLFAKRVPPEGDTINGKYVPGGTKIGYGGFSIFRNKKYGAKMQMCSVRRGGLKRKRLKSRSRI
jgi:cytochrome P450